MVGSDEAEGEGSSCRPSAARAGLLDKWSHRLDANDDLVWRAILQFYGDHGQPPQIADIAGEIGFEIDHVETALRALDRMI
ncbi:hypothetical protein CWS35_38715 (plasmid) [Bradyrhizobium sp. SK17]|uniref:hypothetical protein n=1 Tax=Bradyrhizobium sp. SK17 TaxID=2057741 RepID=UPI000C2FFA55|nr:hypothetical protein [Bradyrhizobium sp. SK17]AUD00310.1 hypothetical protein CWS35_38715 [Bradyrhizobium sp. SK17]